MGGPTKRGHAVSLIIEDGQTVPEMSYDSIPLKTTFMPPQLSFFKQGQPVLNHRRLMFRAEEQTARLVISDWASDHSAGGPEGQELMFNYIQLEPYFEASSR